MSWWTVLKYFVLGIFCSAEWIGERRRIHAMRALARKFGLAFLGKKRLPEALSLYGTPFAHIQLLPVANLIDGMRNGVRVIVFDGEVWEGKTFWRRTVVAARAPETFLLAPPQIRRLRSIAPPPGQSSTTRKDSRQSPKRSRRLRNWRQSWMGSG
jgi:hypothetical protein